MSEVKGTITRRMDSVLNGLHDEFKSLCDKKDFEQKLFALKMSWSKSDMPSKLRDLYSLLDLCGIRYERKKDYAYYEQLVLNSHIPSFAEIEDKMLLALYKIFESYPTPEEYMHRIVDRLCNSNDGWAGESLRLRILKQFIKYGNYLSDAGYGGKKAIIDYVKAKTGSNPTSHDILVAVDDELFTKLNEATKAQKKPEGKYGLLKVADDLATGKFRSEGATKKSLYFFAMVFNMSFYSGSEKNGQIIDYSSDIEVNLFQDYYSNNLMRFITDAYKGKLSEYELDPSGQGINYKNYAEVIYLYYISKTIAAEQKIKLSTEMIERVQSKMFKQDSPSIPKTDKTKFFMNLFTEDVMELSESAFEELLCKYYNCDTFAGTYITGNRTMDGKTSPFQLERDQNSAYCEYNALLNKLSSIGVSIENCNYGLWFTDVAAFRKQGYKSLVDRYPQVDKVKFDEFINLLLSINSFVGYTVEEKTSEQNEKQEWTDPSKYKTKALYVKSADAITRTSLIVAYYYYYNALHENDSGERWKSFEELFNDFSRGINRILDLANYQRISGKSIFDVLIVFSSYAYMNI